MRGVGVVPGVLGCVEPLPCVFPGAEGVWPEFEPPAFAVPGASLVVPGVVLGKVPHGEPLGEVPGVVEVFGLTVEGWVLPPGVGAVGEFDPGTVPGAFGF